MHSFCKTFLNFKSSCFRFRVILFFFYSLVLLNNYQFNNGLRVAPPTAIRLCFLWAETDCSFFLYLAVEIKLN